jgi:type I restriction enzyme S subunit
LAATTGSTFPSIDGKSIRAIDVLAPPLSEQTAIAEVLSDMDAELAALEQRLAKTRDLKQGMMQELLTGRTRLV